MSFNFADHITRGHKIYILGIATDCTVPNEILQVKLEHQYENFCREGDFQETFYAHQTRKEIYKARAMVTMDHH